MKNEEKNETAAKKEETEDAISDILLSPPYETAKETETKTQEERNATLSLKYNITEDYSDKVTDNSVTLMPKDEKKASTTYLRLSLDAGISKIITLSNEYTSTLSYSETSDREKNTWSRKLTSSPLNTTKIALTSLGLTYTLSLKPYEFEETESDSSVRNVTKSSFDFNSTFVKTHSLVYNRTVNTSLGTFTGEVKYVLPPLEGSLTPLVKWSQNGLTLTLSWLFRDTGSYFEKDNLKLLASYSSSFFILSSTMEYQTREQKVLFESLSPLQMSTTMRLRSRDSRYYLEGVFKASGERQHFLSEVRSTVRLDAVSAQFIFRSRNSQDSITFDSVTLTSNFTGSSFQLWKGRLYMAFSLNSTLLLSRTDRSSSYLTFTPSLTFSIAEFLDFKFSFRTQNNRLSSYYSGDSFSLPLFWDDLLRSIDFFGSGRRKTSFIMQSASLEAVHYMDDWNLNFKYTTSFVKNTSGGRTVYSLQPSLSVYLAWNTMPDLKAEENWVKNTSSGEWLKK